LIIRARVYLFKASFYTRPWIFYKELILLAESAAGVFLREFVASRVNECGTRESVVINKYFTHRHCLNNINLSFSALELQRPHPSSRPTDQLKLNKIPSPVLFAFVAHDNRATCFVHLIALQNNSVTMQNLLLLQLQ
jgi:hypothetical protein